MDCSILFLSSFYTISTIIGQPPLEKFSSIHLSVEGVPSQDELPLLLNKWMDASTTLPSDFLPVIIIYLRKTLLTFPLSR